jgi:hypothetical protein
MGTPAKPSSRWRATDVTLPTPRLRRPADPVTPILDVHEFIAGSRGHPWHNRPPLQAAKPTTPESIWGRPLATVA